MITMKKQKKMTGTTAHTGKGIFKWPYMTGAGGILTTTTISGMTHIAMPIVMDIITTRIIATTPFLSVMYPYGIRRILCHA